MDEILEIDLLNKKFMYCRSDIIKDSSLKKSIEELQNYLSGSEIDRFLSKITSDISFCSENFYDSISVEKLQEIIDYYQTMSDSNQSLVFVKNYIIELKKVVKLKKVRRQYFKILDLRPLIRSVKNNIKNIVTEEDSKINITALPNINFKIFKNEFKNRTFSTNKLCTV